MQKKAVSCTCRGTAIGGAAISNRPRPRASRCRGTAIFQRSRTERFTLSGASIPFVRRPGTAVALLGRVGRPWSLLKLAAPVRALDPDVQDPRPLGSGCFPGRQSRPREVSAMAKAQRQMDFMLRVLVLSRDRELVARLREVLFAAGDVDLLRSATTPAELLAQAEAHPPERQDAAGRSPGSPYLRRLLVRSSGTVRILPVEEILWIDAIHNAVKLHASQGEFRLRQSIAALAAELDPVRFARIHRSTVVRLDA